MNQNLTWRSLNSAINLWDEEKLLNEINLELSNKGRAYLLKRMFQRYATLRNAREQTELLSKAKKN